MRQVTFMGMRLVVDNDPFDLKGEALAYVHTIQAPGAWDANKDEAVNHLGSLGQGAGSCRQALEAGAHTALAGVLRKSNNLVPWRAKARAAQALAGIADTSVVALQAVMACEGILDNVVKLLDNESAFCKRFGALLVCNLAAIFLSRQTGECIALYGEEIAIQRGDVVPAIVRAIESVRGAAGEDAVKTRWHAAGALQRLAAAGVRGNATAIPAAVHAAGAAPALASILPDDPSPGSFHAGAVDEAVKALSEIAHSSPDGAAAVQAVPGLLQKLEALRQSSHEVPPEPHTDTDYLGRLLQDIQG